MAEIRFASREHESFFHEMMKQCGNYDSYHKAFFYCMGISDTARTNVGRELLGRQTREPAKQDMDKGILAKVQRAYLSCGQLFSSMEKSAENAMRRMEKFTGEKKPSVKGELKRIKSKQSAKQAMQRWHGKK